MARDPRPRRPARQLSERQQLALEAHRMMVADRVAGHRARKKAEVEEIKKLSPEEIKEQLAPTQGEMDAYLGIRRGETYRGAGFTVSAMHKYFDLVLEKPRQGVDVDGGVEVVVKTLVAKPVEEPAYELPAGASVTALPEGGELTTTGAPALEGDAG